VRAGANGAAWFAGQLCYHDLVSLPSGEDAYADEARFAAELPVVLDQLAAAQRAGYAAYGLYVCHPTRLRYLDFWDVLNYARGMNTPPAKYRVSERRTDAEYQLSLHNVRRMILAARDLPGICLRGTGAISHRFGVENGPVWRADLTGLAQAVLDQPGLDVTNPLASPAQTLDLLARGLKQAAAGRPIAALLSRTVLGPFQPPPMLDSPVAVNREGGLAICAALVDSIAKTDSVPVALSINGMPVGPGALLRGLAAAWVAGNGVDLPAAFVFTPDAEEPVSAAPWVDEWIYRILPDWTPHRRDLKLDQLALHTRLQSWSLKPAQVAD
jgi:hypothetical protein